MLDSGMVLRRGAIVVLLAFLLLFVAGQSRHEDVWQTGNVSTVRSLLLKYVPIEKVRVAGALLVCAWLLAIFLFEQVMFQSALSRTKWPLAASPNGLRLLVLADPQLTDEFSYPERPRFLYRPTIAISDAFMRKSFRLLRKTFKPDGVIILGDLFDGGRHWDDKRFSGEYERWKRIFYEGKERDQVSLPFYTIPGNHDIGVSYALHAEAIPRFERYFDPINKVWHLQTPQLDVSLISVAALTLADPAQTGTRIYSDQTMAFIQDVAERIPSNHVKILLTHVPLYRAPDAPSRFSNRIKQYFGSDYQNLITEPYSQHILDRIMPDMVLSGDDHEVALHVNHIHGKAIPDWTVKTFSFMQGNLVPGYGLLSISPAATTDETAKPMVEFRSGHLPRYLTALITYIVLGVTTAVYALIYLLVSTLQNQ